MLGQTDYFHKKQIGNNAVERSYKRCPRVQLKAFCSLLQGIYLNDYAAHLAVRLKRFYHQQKLTTKDKQALAYYITGEQILNCLLIPAKTSFLEMSPINLLFSSTTG